LLGLIALFDWSPSGPILKKQAVGRGLKHFMYVKNKNNSESTSPVGQRAVPYRKLDFSWIICWMKIHQKKSTSVICITK